MKIANLIKYFVSVLKGMFEYSSLPISDHPMVLESIIAQQVEDGAEFVIDGRMAHLFSEMKDSEQLKFLSKVCHLINNIVTMKTKTNNY